ncbi:MAG: FAD-dependent thymidylate synthase [Mycobacteriaceae bacterium]
MPRTVPLRVRLVGRTELVAPEDLPFTSDADGGQAVAELAGRAVYQSWARERPATASNAGFLAHLVQVGHLSVLEHASATLHVSGVSRAVAHEVVRHRHLSVSELSPRHVPSAESEIAVPELVAQDPVATQMFDEAVDAARRAHDALLARLAESGATTPAARKQARQVALGVLPRASATELVVTGSYRAWRHFVAARGTDLTDPEVRALAVACLGVLRVEAPHVFADFETSTLTDGSTVASSPYAIVG